MIKEKDNEVSKIKLEQIDNELAEKCGNKIYLGIQEEDRGIENDGGYNPSHLWKLRIKLRPKISDPPTAMKDTNGKLVTSAKEVS